MTSVETLNAVMREKARIREEVVKLPSKIHGNDTLIKRSEVLAIISNDSKQV
jgi:hypothetical protein